MESRNLPVRAHLDKNEETGQILELLLGELNIKKYDMTPFKQNWFIPQIVLGGSVLFINSINLLNMNVLR